MGQEASRYDEDELLHKEASQHLVDEDSKHKKRHQREKSSKSKKRRHASIDSVASPGAQNAPSPDPDLGTHLKLEQLAVSVQGHTDDFQDEVETKKAKKEKKKKQKKRDKEYAAPQQDFSVKDERSSPPASQELKPPNEVHDPIITDVSPKQPEPSNGDRPKKRKHDKTDLDRMPRDEPEVRHKKHKKKHPTEQAQPKAVDYVEPKHETASIAQAFTGRPISSSPLPLASHPANKNGTGGEGKKLTKYQAKLQKIIGKQQHKPVQHIGESDIVKPVQSAKSDPFKKQRKADRRKSQTISNSGGIDRNTLPKDKRNHLQAASTRDQRRLSSDSFTMHPSYKHRTVSKKDFGRDRKKDGSSFEAGPRGNSLSHTPLLSNRKSSAISSRLDVEKSERLRAPVQRELDSEQTKEMDAAALWKAKRKKQRERKKEKRSRETEAVRTLSQLNPASNFQHEDRNQVAECDKVIPATSTSPDPIRASASRLSPNKDDNGAAMDAKTKLVTSSIPTERMARDKKLDDQTRRSTAKDSLKLNRITAAEDSSLDTESELSDESIPDSEAERLESSDASRALEANATQSGTSDLLDADMILHGETRRLFGNSVDKSELITDSEVAVDHEDNSVALNDMSILRAASEELGEDLQVVYQCSEDMEDQEAGAEDVQNTELIPEKEIAGAPASSVQEQSSSGPHRTTSPNNEDLTSPATSADKVPDASTLESAQQLQLHDSQEPVLQNPAQDKIEHKTLQNSTGESIQSIAVTPTRSKVRANSSARRSTTGTDGNTALPDNVKSTVPESHNAEPAQTPEIAQLGWSFDQYESVLAMAASHLSSRPENRGKNTSIQRLRRTMDANPSLSQWFAEMEKAGLIFDRVQLCEALKAIMPLVVLDTDTNAGPKSNPEIVSISDDQSTDDSTDGNHSSSKEDSAMDYLAEQLLQRSENGLLVCLQAYTVQEICRELKIPGTPVPFSQSGGPKPDAMEEPSAATATGKKVSDHNRGEREEESPLYSAGIVPDVVSGYEAATCSDKAELHALKETSVPVASPPKHTVSAKAANLPQSSNADPNVSKHEAAKLSPDPEVLAQEPSFEPLDNLHEEDAVVQVEDDEDDDTTAATSDVASDHAPVVQEGDRDHNDDEEVESPFEHVKSVGSMEAGESFALSRNKELVMRVVVSDSPAEFSYLHRARMQVLKGLRKGLHELKRTGQVSNATPIVMDTNFLVSVAQSATQELESFNVGLDGASDDHLDGLSNTPLDDSPKDPLDGPLIERPAKPRVAICTRCNTESKRWYFNAIAYQWICARCYNVEHREKMRIQNGTQPKKSRPAKPNDGKCGNCHEEPKQWRFVEDLEKWFCRRCWARQNYEAKRAAEQSRAGTPHAKVKVYQKLAKVLGVGLAEDELLLLKLRDEEKRSWVDIQAYFEAKGSLEQIDLWKKRYQRIHKRSSNTGSTGGHDVDSHDRDFVLS